MPPYLPLGDRQAADWRDLAACLDHDPELFFPLGESGPSVPQIQDAKRVCARCAVREPCLAWALQNVMEHGVWGGSTDAERRAVRRRSARRSRLVPPAADEVEEDV